MAKEALVVTVQFDPDEAMPWGDLRDDIVGAIEDFSERERPRSLHFLVTGRDEDLPREGDGDDGS